MIVASLALCLSAGAVGASEDANKTTVRRYYELGINQARVDLADELLTSDFVKVTNGDRSAIVGPEALRRAVASHVESNSEYAFVVEELIAESDSVVARWRWQSINTRYGAPRTISIHGIAIFSFSDGKIARLWQVFDMKSFNDQAGIK